MLRSSLLLAGRSPRLRHVMETSALSGSVVDRFVAGRTVDAALATVSGLVGKGLAVTLDHLGEDTTDRVQAEATVGAYEALLAAVRHGGLASSTEVSVKLSAVGQFLGPDGTKIALDGARRICEAAAAAGTTVTLDMEDHTTTDSTLAILAELRADFPWVGAVLQAYLRRTEADCRDLAGIGSRVRLCKGAYREPESVAFTARADVDLAYVRCLRILMAGDGYPMVATHDPRMIAIAGRLADDAGRSAGDHEYQMLHGVRPHEQLRLAGAGKTLRVYLPYGADWYPYFLRRLAERPANVAFLLRSLATKS